MHVGLAKGSQKDPFAKVLGDLLELEGATELAGAHVVEVTVDEMVGLAQHRPDGARSPAEKKNSIQLLAPDSDRKGPPMINPGKGAPGAARGASGCWGS